MSGDGVGRSEPTVGSWRRSKIAWRRWTGTSRWPHGPAVRAHSTPSRRWRSRAMSAPAGTSAANEPADGRQSPDLPLLCPLTARGGRLRGRRRGIRRPHSPARRRRTPSRRIPVRRAAAPDITGFEVADQLAAEPGVPRILLISSRAARDLGSRLEATRAASFIAKSDRGPATLGAALASTAAEWLHPPGPRRRFGVLREGLAGLLTAGGPERHPDIADPYRRAALVAWQIRASHPAVAVVVLSPSGRCASWKAARQTG